MPVEDRAAGVEGQRLDPVHQPVLSPIIATRTAGTMKFPRTAFSRSSSLANPSARRAMTAAPATVSLHSQSPSCRLDGAPSRRGFEVIGLQVIDGSNHLTLFSQLL
jgi:hypothetical protein